MTTDDTHTDENDCTATNTDDSHTPTADERGEWTVPLSDGAIGSNTALQHGLAGPVIFMGLPKLHGWRPFASQKLAHQTYVKHVEDWLADGHANAREVAVMSTSTARWKTVWSSSREDSHHADDRDATLTNNELFDQQDRATLEEAVETWGIDAQVDMAEEEAAEFIAASKHYARGKVPASELVDELADLRIMQEQLSMFLGRERVERQVQRKMDRLRERIADATGGENGGDDGE